MTQKNRAITLTVLLLAVVGIITGLIACGPRPAPAPSPTDLAQPSASPVVTVSVPAGPGTYTWAFAPMQDGAKISGSADGNTQNGSIESIVKVWLAADFLRDQETVSFDTLTSIREMVRESDDEYAQGLYERLGADVSLHRMIDVCGLTRTQVIPFWWSLTRTTADDLVRLGWCIASGVAAGPVWTPWLLDVMRTEHHTGRWGIVEGVVPPALQPKIAYMNGWTQHSTGWQVNCLAIGPTWMMAVMTRYPLTNNERHGADICASIARQLTSVLPTPSPEPLTAMASPT